MATFLSIPGSPPEPLARDSVALPQNCIRQMFLLSIWARTATQDQLFLICFDGAQLAVSAMVRLGFEITCSVCVWRGLLSQRAIASQPMRSGSSEFSSEPPLHLLSGLVIPMSPPRTGQRWWFPVQRMSIIELYLHRLHQTCDLRRNVCFSRIIGILGAADGLLVRNLRA